MSKEELADFAPILPQEQFQKNFEENQSREPWNLSDLFALAPFMEEEDVGRFALKFADSGHAPSEFVGLAPFMDEKSLGEIVNRLTESGHAPSEFAGLASVAPFLGEGAIKNLFKGFGKE